MTSDTKTEDPAIRVPAKQLEGFAARMFQALGMCVDDAAILAKQMIWSELRGYPWLGAKKIIQYGARLKTGATDARAIPTIIAEKAAFVHYDGQNSFGQIAGEIAMNRVIEKSEDAGACIAVVRNTGSAFSLGYFAEVAAKRRKIGMAINNAPPLMPVYGGAEKVIGNQAFAIGSPTGEHGALILDTALSEATLVAIHKCQMQGKTLPPGWGLDAEGCPTTDPATALAGMLVPLAGHRGSGLAIMWEALTGVLAGGERFLSDVTMPGVYGCPQATSMFFMAINPEVALPYQEYLARVDTMIDKIHASRPAENVEQIFVPGEQGAERAKKAAREGVILSASFVDELKEFGAEVGVDWD